MRPWLVVWLALGLSPSCVALTAAAQALDEDVEGPSDAGVAAPIDELAVPPPPLELETAAPIAPLGPAFVEVRGASMLVLHRLVSSIATDIPSVTHDEWETICAVPCTFVPDRAASEVYGISRGGSVLRADDQPIFWLDAAALRVELVDRSDVRAAGVALLTVLSVAGLLVTLVPSFVHVEPDGAVATTLVGSGLVVVGTAAGLPLIFWGDTARVEPE